MWRWSHTTSSGDSPCLTSLLPEGRRFPMVAHRGSWFTATRPPLHTAWSYGPSAGVSLLREPRGEGLASRTGGGCDRFREWHERHRQIMDSGGEGLVHAWGPTHSYCALAHCARSLQRVLVEPLQPAPKRGGRPEKHPWRSIVDGILSWFAPAVPAIPAGGLPAMADGVLVLQGTGQSHRHDAHRAARAAAGAAGQ